MIVLDADQPDRCADPARLVRAIQTAPSLGELQYRSQLIGATTFFRPPAAIRRLRLWTRHQLGPQRLVVRQQQLWGHNSIIRMAAFAQNCGRPSSRAASRSGGFGPGRIPSSPH